MIIDIEETNTLIIGGNISIEEQETIRIMFEENKTINEVKDFLVNKGHTLLDESGRVKTIGIKISLEEEKEMTDLFNNLKDLGELLNKTPNPFCTNPSHEHYIKPEDR